MAKPNPPEELWQKLYVSDDISMDLSTIYSDDFFEDLVSYFDKSPHSFELIFGVHQTVKTYLNARWHKSAHMSELLKFTGSHLIQASAAAKQLETSLSQIRKSALMEAVLFEDMEQHLDDNKPRGRDAYRAAKHKTGPGDPFAILRELSNAFSKAADNILPPQGDQETDADTRKRAMAFVETSNENRNSQKERLPAHYALEEAAKAFQPIWERYSTKRFTQGRYYHERGGYDSPSTAALHKIIAKIDSSVPESLVGTAIKNISSQLKAD